MITPRMCLTHSTGFANFWFHRTRPEAAHPFRTRAALQLFWRRFHPAAIRDRARPYCRLVGAGVLQARIYTRQKGINARQLEIGMNDQRGWIKAVQKMERAKPDDIDSWAAENASVSALVQFANTGKTPIYEVQAKMAVRIIERTPYSQPI